MPLLWAAALAAAASAQAPAEGWRPAFEPVWESGVEASKGSKIMRALRSVQVEYPGLSGAHLLKKIVLASPQRQLGNVHYCHNPDGIVVPPDNGCHPAHHLTIVADVDLLLSFESRYPDFYKPGREVEAVLFHELLHGWAYLHEDQMEEYHKAASDGRQTVFDRRKSRIFRHLWTLERRVAAARGRVEIGGKTRAQYAAEGDGELDRLVRGERWDALTRTPLAQAERSLRENERRLEELRPRLALRVERFARRHKYARRDARDVHALDDCQEWFAYGGEIYFFAKAPEELLTPEEMAWWRAREPELRGGLVAAD